MNNRHLYKAKRLDNGEWVEGYLFFSWERAYILWGTTNDVPNMVEVDPSTLCQCTGLKDKNGKPIWENDIIRNTANIHWDLQKVEYGNCRNWIIDGIRNKPFKASRCGCLIAGEAKLIFEVIGNIFDNPKLLEAGE